MSLVTASGVPVNFPSGPRNSRRLPTGPVLWWFLWRSYQVSQLLRTGPRKRAVSVLSDGKSGSGRIRETVIWRIVARYWRTHQVFSTETRNCSLQSPPFLIKDNERKVIPVYKISPISLGDLHKGSKKGNCPTGLYRFASLEPFMRNLSETFKRLYLEAKKPSQELNTRLCLQSL